MAARKKTAKKTSRKTSAAKAKPKVSELSQTHGKTEKFKPTTLDQIWGDTGMNKYKTLDEEEYKQRLKDMAKVDLQTHAAEVGLIPIDNTTQLKKRLLSEFKKYTSSFKVPDVKSNNDKNNLSKEAQKILNEGK
jgi:hypothetical protein